MIAAAIRVKGFLQPDEYQDDAGVIMDTVNEVMCAALDGLVKCDKYAGQLKNPLLKAIMEYSNTGVAVVDFFPDGSVVNIDA